LSLKSKETLSSSQCEENANQTPIKLCSILASPLEDRPENDAECEESGQSISEVSEKADENLIDEASTTQKKPSETDESSTPAKQPITETYKREAEENEHFDPHFYKNIIATRQQDETKRSCETVDKRRQRDTEVTQLKVIAKVVDDKNDHIETITVKQTSYIGSGVFSDVYRGFALRDGQTEANVEQVAIKKIWPDPSREDRQIGVHRRLRHPNIARLLFYFVCVHPKTRVASWTLIMDLMPSTVAREQSTFIDKGLLIPQVYVKLWMFQTLSALSYMERASISHRDIKPENLLVDTEIGTLKIGDFGSAKVHRAGETSNSYQVTRYYRAPELCFGFTKYDATVDVWSAGCILAELLTNRIIFYGRNNADQLKKIIRIIGTPTMRQLSGCIPGHYVSESIFRKIYPRVDMFQLLYKYNKAITADCVAFVNGILRYESHERLRGKKALDHPYFHSLHLTTTRLPNGCPLPPLYYA
uniref:Putative glycogen synthase kinase 3-related (inferred by orthology to a S. mansoni protein) n=1 Tax=Anisakis simplex TaxID=6269 RepID=A0A0M3K253_ANISI